MTGSFSLKTTRFYIALILAATASVLELKLSAAAGFKPTIILGILIPLAFFFTGFEVAVFSITAAIILNWQPAASPETLTLILFPTVLASLRQFLPGVPWLNMLASTAVAFSVFYALAGFSLLVKHAGFFVADVSVNMALALIVFQLFRYLYGNFQTA